MKERWLPVPGFEASYSISNLGRVRRDTSATCTWVGRILKPQMVRGYMTVHFVKNGHTRRFRVHTLVTAAFLGPVPAGCQVNHKSGDKKDNRLRNLEYLTPSENVLHAVKVFGYKIGTRNGSAKLNEKKVARIRSEYATGKRTQQSIADEFSVSQLLVSLIVRKKIWRHV